MTTPETPRTLEYVPLDAIEVAKWNPKDHDAHAIAASISEHGYVAPMVLDSRTGRLVAGHGRRDELLRARAAGDPPPEGVTIDADGRWMVPVVTGWRSRNDEQVDRYVVADNRTTEAGGWVTEDLADRLARWRDADQLDGTGWTPRDANEFLRHRDETLGHNPEPSSDDYYTPAWVFDGLGLEFDLDVASPPVHPEWIPAKRYYTEADDGLASPWEGMVWMNPPYSNPGPWVAKFMEHGNGVALLPFSNSKWWRGIWDSDMPIGVVGDRSIDFVGGGISLPTFFVAAGEEATRGVHRLCTVRVHG